MDRLSPRETPPRRVRQFVLLAGGKGTRLGSLTASTPKPLMDIGQGRVFLDLLIDNIIRQGFEQILILAGHFGEQVVARYHGKTIRGCALSVVIEPAPMGTGGALRWSRAMLESEFFLANGDTYFDICYRRIEQAMRAEIDTDAAIALRHVEDAGRYGSIELSGLRIARFSEKTASPVPVAGLINGGVYLLSRALVETFPAGELSLETEVFPKLATERRMVGQASTGYFIDIGLPETLQQARDDIHSVIRRPALFLDRDGVINRDHGYVHAWDRFNIITGVAETIARYNNADWLVFVVTNQAGIARGYYPEEAVHLLHGQLQDWLAVRGAHIDAFYHCPFHPEGIVEKFRGQHMDRKPRPGMLLRAMQDFAVDASRSFLIGDRASDLEAASGAGLRGYLFEGDDLESFISAQGLFPA